MSFIADAEPAVGFWKKSVAVTGRNLNTHISDSSWFRLHLERLPQIWTRNRDKQMSNVECRIVVCDEIDTPAFCYGRTIRSNVRLNEKMRALRKNSELSRE